MALARLALHLHGIGPGVAGFDVGESRGVTLDARDDDIREIATHYLRSMFATVGTGRPRSEYGATVCRVGSFCSQST